MAMLFYHSGLNEQDEVLEFPEFEAKHIVKVLRMKEGDEVEITNGKGVLANGVISEITKKSCLVKIEKAAFHEKLTPNTHLIIAPTKNMDRMEYLVEKATELGVKRISFIQTKRSERTKMKMERIDKIAISAMKQSGQVWLPEIEHLRSFEECVSSLHGENKYIAYCEGEDRMSLCNIETRDNIILVGPEGDFTSEEVQFAGKVGFVKINLGRNRLRTETAGLHIVSYFYAIHE